MGGGVKGGWIHFYWHGEKKNKLKNKFSYFHNTCVTLHKKHQRFKCHGGHFWLLKYFGTFLWLTWNISDKAAG